MNKSNKFKKKRPDLPKFKKDERQMQLAWDESRKSYSPQRMFAYWEKSHILQQWVREGVDIDGTSMKLALNYPDFILRNFNRWYHAQGDWDFTITVPWDELDVWLKKNGFTGKVDKKYIGRKKDGRQVMAEEPRAHGNPKGVLHLGKWL